MPLPIFPDEATFREQWIRPFLSNMGFAHVHLTHGAGEQGKDFFFADYDRFEHQRFYAAQVKNGSIGGGDKETADLLFQVQKCFKVRLQFHKDAHQRRISAVYVMASGKISPAARQLISEWCDSEKMGENIYFLDGDTLDRMQTLTIRKDDELKRRLLIGLIEECSFNMTTLAQCRSELEAKRGSLWRLKTTSAEYFLSEPISDLIKPGIVTALWERLVRVNTVCQMYCWPFKTSDEDWKLFVEMTDHAKIQLEHVSRLAKESLAALIKRQTIRVELVS